MKPYRQVAIVECGEPLVPIPPHAFVLQQPHPYHRLGAPYQGASPFCLRQSVLDRLLLAQEHLQRQGWRIRIFDAYRPVAVQQFMVEHTLALTAQAQDLDPARLTQSQRQTLLEQVYQIWAVPSLDMATPPPHSTGAAVDVTLVDDGGEVAFMGSPIDELSERSRPDYFAAVAANPEVAQRERDRARTAHQHRQVLWEGMQAAGFQRHPNEWWHFSWGDQMWAWSTHQQDPAAVVARYGRVA